MPQGTLRDQLLYPKVARAHGLDKEGYECDPSADDPRLLALLEDVGLSYLPGRFEDGFDHANDWGRVLSRGEQQRLAVVRCLARRPKFVILDEATSALSRPDEDIVYRRLQELDVPMISVG